MTKLLIGLDDGPNVFDHASDVILCKNAADTLAQHYPYPHLWAVNIEGGVMNIRNLFCSPVWGYRIPRPGDRTASELHREVMMGAGEILERFHMRRGRFDEAQYAALKTNIAGDPVFDL